MFLYLAFTYCGFECVRLKIYKKTLQLTNNKSHGNNFNDILGSPLEIRSVIIVDILIDIAIVS